MAKPLDSCFYWLFFFLLLLFVITISSGFFGPFIFFLFFLLGRFFFTLHLFYKKQPARRRSRLFIPALDANWTNWISRYFFVGRTSASDRARERERENRRAIPGLLSSYLSDERKGFLPSAPSTPLFIVIISELTMRAASFYARVKGVESTYTRRKKKQENNETRADIPSHADGAPELVVTTGHPPHAQQNGVHLIFSFSLFSLSSILIFTLRELISSKSWSKSNRIGKKSLFLLFFFFFFFLSMREWPGFLVCIIDGYGVRNPHLRGEKRETRVLSCCCWNGARCDDVVKTLVWRSSCRNNKPISWYILFIAPLSLSLSAGPAGWWWNLIIHKKRERATL